ncbi:uncharacterized protein LOC128908985 isoform X3 [Rissa tridactyla]|uniref:uncharacterized protein LOC128908985 isoform X3 n=1 Tax=Rissa tridactyla TaxID=75485 RepID=UPI0023BA681E|nr:uncharacterized protein LOC128908985 isoform X3 [Rissa tridactyla]
MPEMGATPWGAAKGGLSCQQRGPGCPAQGFAGSCSPKRRFPGWLLLLRCLCVTHRPCSRAVAPVPPWQPHTAAQPGAGRGFPALPSPRRGKAGRCGRGSSGGCSRETPSCSHGRGGPSRAAAPRGWQGTGHRPLRFARHQPRAPGHNLSGKTRFSLGFARSAVTDGHRPPAAASARDARSPVPSRALGQPRLPLRLLSVSLPQVFALTCIYLPASLLSLLGSGSVLAVTSRRRRCCHIQLRPLFLLALADFLAAAALLGTATIQLLPARLFIPAYAACPYGRMLATTFYAVSFLMVVVYAYEAYRTVQGWRAWHVAALQERSRCLESLWRGLPYILAWLVPALTLLGQLVARGTSTTDIAPRPIEPVVPWKGNRSHETYSLYCSSCLLLIRRAQDICFQYVGRKDVGLEGKIIFFLYLLLVLSCCTLLYRRVKLRCRRNAAEPLLTLEKDGFAGRSIRSVSNVSHYFQLVFLLCWAPAFLLTLLSFTSIRPASVFVLYVTTALTVSLQGFLHSLVYGWMRRNFRQEAVGERPSLRRPHGLKAFYDESLRAIP